MIGGAGWSLSGDRNGRGGLLLRFFLARFHVTSWSKSSASVAAARRARSDLGAGRATVCRSTRWRLHLLSGWRGRLLPLKGQPEQRQLGEGQLQVTGSLNAQGTARNRRKSCPRSLRTYA